MDHAALRYCFLGKCDLMACYANECCYLGRCLGKNDENCSSKSQDVLLIEILSILIPILIIFILALVAFLCSRRRRKMNTQKVQAPLNDDVPLPLNFSYPINPKMHNYIEAAPIPMLSGITIGFDSSEQLSFQNRIKNEEFFLEKIPADRIFGGDVERLKHSEILKKFET
jgi:hypothetical protein